jgi:hypothetical protein
MRLPDYNGGGLVNLVAELEHRLRGDAPSPGLYPELAEAIPKAASYVLVLFDGLGDEQLDHPGAAPLTRSRVGALDAAFSTQTTVNTSTLATALPPSQHGLIAYQLRIHTTVLNTIYWHLDTGARSTVEPASFLPVPNLAERLARADARVVATEPGAFVGSPLDRVLFRGATVHGTDDADESIRIAVEAARQPGTLALLYLPHVDAAAHTAGQESTLYDDALRHVSGVWSRLTDRLPPDTVAIGTADHGHIDIPEDRRITLPPSETLILWGDNRVVYVNGSASSGAELALATPAEWVSVEDTVGLWGPQPYSPAFIERLPDGLLIADDGYALVPYGTTDAMIGHHGGITERELRVPLLVA